MRTHLSSLLTALALLWPSLSHAQLMVTIDLERDSYISQEPTVATVMVENRAGKDIVLGGPGGASWLTMDVRKLAPNNVEGILMSARNGEEPKPSTVLLKDGGMVQRKIDIQAYYPMESGQYAVSCTVYFADLDRWVGPEKRTPLLITAPRKPFFEQTVGLAETNGYRKYKLFSCPSVFRSGPMKGSKNLLYVQICDEVSEDTLVIYPLGEVLKYYPPQPTVDPNNDLHVLYQTGPKMFSHATISTKGDIRLFEQHESVEGSRPELKRNQVGTIAVRGGRYYDPKAELLLSKERAKEQRSLSDRPEGLPEENKEE